MEADLEETAAGIRTLKFASDKLHGATIYRTHAGLPWMAAYSARLINRSRKGPDGRTAWELRRGRAWRQPLVPCAECVMYLAAGKRESRLDS
eukprot:10119675-Karenia_brevis.AAC.1